MASAGQRAQRKVKIAVAGGVETPEKVKITTLSPAKRAQREVDRITKRAETYRFHGRFILASQALKAAAELQVRIWLS